MTFVRCLSPNLSANSSEIRFYTNKLLFSIPASMAPAWISSLGSAQIFWSEKVLGRLIVCIYHFLLWWIVSLNIIEFMKICTFIYPTQSSRTWFPAWGGMKAVPISRFVQSLSKCPFDCWCSLCAVVHLVQHNAFALSYLGTTVQRKWEIRYPKAGCLWSP